MSFIKKLKDLCFYFYFFYYIFMKTSVKKLVAGASVLALIVANSAFAELSLTGSTTGLSLTGSTETLSGSTVTWDLNVTTTAQVLPTLSFSISSPNVELWILSPWEVTTGSATTLTLSTNAIDWAVVSISSSTGWLSSEQWGLIAFSGGTLIPWEEWYNLSVGTPSASTWATPTIGNAIIDSSTPINVMSVAWPTNWSTVDITTNASISNITPAGNYSVIHTYSVTWTF